MPNKPVSSLKHKACRAKFRRRKPTYLLYAIMFGGRAGEVFHSLDYPKVWHTRPAAKDYWLSIPEVSRSIYSVGVFALRPLTQREANGGKK